MTARSQDFSDSSDFSGAPDFSTAKVLVVGDVMLDRYWSGPAERISPEAPVPIIRVEELTERCGGAANVALNIARLGGQVSLIGAIGDDAEGRALTALLESAGVNCRLVAGADTGTTLKLRLLSQHHQLMRLDFERPVTPEQVSGISEAFDDEVTRHDVVVFSDYGKGALPEVSRYIDRCCELGRASLVDPWGSSFARYRKASAITPNAREFALAAGDWASETELEKTARSMIGELPLGAVLVTRGERGMSLFEHERDAVHIPSEAREVFDVTGAGDTVIAALAAGLGTGRTMESAARLANRAAGLVVARLGTAAPTAAELADSRILSPAGLVAAVREAQGVGQRVVMTNGCFDIIHAGHIAYLREAAALGDRLVVAVNSDASVRRLKGPGRPIVPANQRLAVLSALRFVDWVTEFDGVATPDGIEDTPRVLIDEVKPDILVKGGDYRLEDIVGADSVLANGGQVRTIRFIDGVSTTSIVERIKEHGA